MKHLPTTSVLLVNCAELAIENAAGPDRLVRATRVIAGATAAAYAREAEFRLALVRFPLQDYSPKDFVYYLRNAPGSRCRQTSIVAIVDHREQKLIHEGLSAGVNDYLAQPVGDEDLSRMLAKFGQPAARRDAKLMLKAKIDLPLQDKPFFGQTLNLSSRGLLLACDRELMIGAPLDLQFSLPGVPEPVTASSVIMREASERKVRGKAYGVAFVHVDAKSQSRLDGFVA